jgi:hypothetical protein
LHVTTHDPRILESHERSQLAPDPLLDLLLRRHRFRRPFRASDLKNRCQSSPAHVSRSPAIWISESRRRSIMLRHVREPDRIGRSIASAALA